MSADNTKGAVYISDDNLVSFDEKGYRQDSLGNRTYGDGVWGSDKARFSKPVQKEIDRYREEVRKYEEQMKIYLEAVGQAQPGLYSLPQTAATWKPAGSTPTPQPSPSPWTGVSDWRQPQLTQPGPSPAPAPMPMQQQQRPTDMFTGQLDALRQQSIQPWRPQRPEQMPVSTSPASPYTPLTTYDPLGRYTR